MKNQPIYDIRRLKHDLCAAALRARALKAVLRTTWTRPMADEQRALCQLAARVTRLCILRAPWGDQSALEQGWSDETYRRR